MSQLWVSRSCGPYHTAIMYLGCLGMLWQTGLSKLGWRHFKKGVSIYLHFLECLQPTQSCPWVHLDRCCLCHCLYGDYPYTQGPGSVEADCFKFWCQLQLNKPLCTVICLCVCNFSFVWFKITTFLFHFWNNDSTATYRTEIHVCTEQSTFHHLCCCQWEQWEPSLPFE